MRNGGILFGLTVFLRGYSFVAGSENGFCENRWVPVPVFQASDNNWCNDTCPSSIRRALTSRPSPWTGGRGMPTAEVETIWMWCDRMWNVCRRQHACNEMLRDKRELRNSTIRLIEVRTDWRFFWEVAKHAPVYVEMERHQCWVRDCSDSSIKEFFAHSNSFVCLLTENKCTQTGGGNNAPTEGPNFKRVSFQKLFEKQSIWSYNAIYLEVNALIHIFLLFSAYRNWAPYALQDQ